MASRRIDLSIKKTRVGIETNEGKGSTTCYLTEFHNAIMQVRSIAFDGVRWFVQGGDRRAYFKQVGDGEVPQEVKDRINNFINKQ